MYDYPAIDNLGILYKGVYRSRTTVKCSSLLKRFGLAPSIGAHRGVYAFSMIKKHCSVSLSSQIEFATRNTKSKRILMFVP